jgi:hypothetical protein
VLPDVLKVRTADNVQIGYTVAGVPSRMLAFLVDGAINLGIVLLAALGAAAPRPWC